MASISNFYRILDIPYDATFREIKEAYRKKVKEDHPDKEKGSAEKFKRVKEAYETFKNVEQRKRYDDFLFKKAHNETEKLKQEYSVKTNPSIKIIKRKRKQVTFSSVLFNMSLILIGVMGRAYLDRKSEKT